MNTTTNLTIEDFVANVSREFPNIRRHAEDDFNWITEGMEFYEKGEFSKSETVFKQLILSQPENYDGYEWLAMIYNKTEKKNEAIMLIEHAVKLAEKLLEIGDLDNEAFKNILENRKSILK